MGNLVLVVDDDPIVHKLLDAAFRDDHYEVAHCMNAEEAQSYLADHKNVQAIILDWEMPGMSGLEYLERIKQSETYKDIPVIMLTGRNKREEIKMGIDAGAYYYVTKPFVKDILLSVVRSAIAEYQVIKQLAEQVAEARNPFANLYTGTFRIKSIQDAQKLSVLVANATPAPQENLMICELFNNAIEHGNLEISYDEKSALIDRNELRAEIESRLEDPRYKDREAIVQFERLDNCLKVTIEDMGEGFDYERYLTFDEDRVFDNHGRGIAMANTLLDIEYHGKGNVVCITIPMTGQVEA